jgi:hypothetical protein
MRDIDTPKTIGWEIPTDTCRDRTRGEAEKETAQPDWRKHESTRPILDVSPDRHVAGIPIRLFSFSLVDCTLVLWHFCRGVDSGVPI